MRERLNRTAASHGAPDWRLVGETLHLAVDAGSFAAAIEFVGAVASIAEAQRHHPDIDVRFDRVFLRVWSHDVDGLTDRDVTFANAVAREADVRGLRLVPAALTIVDVGIDCRDPNVIAPFWAALLRGTVTRDGDVADTVVDPSTRAAAVWFQQTDAPSNDRGRTHLDVLVAHDEAQARIDAALAAGGRMVDDTDAPRFWILGDADGNVACVCTWQGRDEHDATRAAALA